MSTRKRGILSIPTPTPTPLLPSYVSEPRNNLRVFRTITTYLGDMERSNPILATDNLKGKRNSHYDHRQEILIYDCLAQLAVTEHQISAVATNHPSESELRVIICSNDFPIHESPPISSMASKVASMFKTVVPEWLIVYTRNNNRSEKSANLPIFEPPTVPVDLKGRSAFDYMVALKDHWIRPSEGNHLWILGEVLKSQQKHQNVLSKHLSRYIAAMSYKKIARRFNNKHLSQPYVKSLQDVPVEKIPIMSPPKKELTPVDRHEACNDLYFAQDFLIPHRSGAGLRTSITNLVRVAELAPDIDNTGNSPQVNFQLYTNETSQEFHLLLLELLERFGDFLGTLLGLDEKSGLSEETAPKFKRAVTGLHITGYALLKISRGLAFRMHLENIAKLLRDPRSQVVAEEVKDEDETHLHDDPWDADLGTVLSHVAWLRLMVAHFDAAEIVLQFVSSSNFQYNHISINILVPPNIPTEMDLLPWESLVKFLPQDGKVGSSITNTHIEEFFTKGLAEQAANEEHLKARRMLEKLWKDNKPLKDLSPLLTVLCNATDQTVKESAVASDALLSIHMPTGPDIFVTPMLRHSMKPHIEKILAVPIPPPDEPRSYKENLFFTMQKRKFTGALHCEACLATLLPLFTQRFPNEPHYRDLRALLGQMKDYGWIIGVSKRCCPACAHFLLLLTRTGEKGQRHFLTRGSHTTISACTLPPWTPDSIVDSMITQFARILREDLVAFIEQEQEQDIQRDRRVSTGSRELASDGSKGGVSKRQQFDEHLGDLE